MADDPVAQYLRTLNLPDTVRAMAWDAAYAKDDKAAEAGLRKLPKYLNPKVLADLWDLRQGGTIEGEVKTFAPARAEDFMAPGPEGSAASRFFSNAGKVLNPVTMVSGFYEAFKDRPAMERTLTNIYEAGKAQAGKAAEAYRAGDYREMTRHGLAAALPVLGPAADAAGEQIASGDVAGGLGTMVGLQASVAAPSVLGAVSRTAPAMAARAAVADVVRAQAVPLVRAGVKAPLTLLRQQAGASRTGVNFQANRLAQFLIENRITTPAQATRIIRNSEAELQRILSTRGQTPTDAPARAALYLDILERQASRALTPDHAATVRRAAAELPEGPLGETVPGPTPTGQPLRQLRPDVPAEEALDIARTTSRFETRRSWGEQKGTAMEAVKAQERAVRDAFRQALPEARTPLERQGQAILAERVMDRQVWREANRDVVSLPGLVGLSANAVVGFAAHWLRNNQLRAGIWADQLADAIATNNAAAAAGILSRLRVRLPTLGPLLEQLQAPAPAALPAATADQGTPPGAQ
jgi:hypothetical protein